MTLLALAILALVVGGIAQVIGREKEQQGALLGVVTELKAQQIADWVREREAHGRLLQGDRAFAADYSRWRRDKDAGSRDRLLERLDRVRRADGFDEVLLLDDQGNVLWYPAAASATIDPVLATAVHRSVARGSLDRLGPYRDVSGRLRLDFVAPLANGGRSGPAVLLRSDPAAELGPLLQAWPVPGGGETLLVRHEGGRLLFFNELRRQAEGAATARLPAAAPTPPAAQLGDGRFEPGRFVDASDDRGVATLGATRAVPGTDWLLLARRERADIYASAAAGSLWIGFLSLLALVFAAAGLILHRQRQLLPASRRAADSQAEKPRARELFDALVASSRDGIVILNDQGRVFSASPSFAAMLGCTLEEAHALHVWDWDPAWPKERLLKVLAKPDLAPGIFETRWRRKDGSMLDVEIAGTRLDTNGQRLSFHVCRDVGARKAAAQALCDSETKYRLLSESAVDWIVWRGTDDRIHYVSPACTNISGYAPADFVADPSLMARIVHPDDAAVFSAHLRLEAGASETEFRIIRRDGQVRWISHHCHPLLDEAGNCLGRRGTNRDITRRRQAEEALRKVSLAVDQSPESVVITDLGANIEYVNQAFLNNTGYGREEVIGRNPRVLQSGKTPKATFHSMWEALSQGQCWKGEFINRRKDGSEYVELATIVPICQADGRRTHYLAMKEDISEKKRLAAELDRYHHHLQDLVAERTAQLEASNAEISDLYNHAPCGYDSLDEAGAIVGINDTGLAMLGYAREEVDSGRLNARLLMAPDDKVQFERWIERFVRTGRLRQTEISFRRKDGSVFPGLVSAEAKYDARRKLLYCRATMVDITERKKAEDALLAARADLERQVVERTRQLRQLAVETTLAEEKERRAIARDLHDDLGQILHVAKIKLDMLAKASLGEEARALSVDVDGLIAGASARVRSLTSQLSPPVLDAMGLVPALFWLAEDLERTYGMTVEVEDDGQPKVLTNVQSAILFRAARELLINVVKHAGVMAARVATSLSNERLILSVEDEGQGMHNFGDALASAKGFGLASVRERITYLGGSMEARTIKGHGTLVTLWLPVQMSPLASENSR